MSLKLFREKKHEANSKKLEKQDCQKSITIGLSISIRIILTIEKDRPKVKPR